MTLPRSLLLGATLLASLLPLAASRSLAQTKVVNDTFTAGSTINSNPASPAVPSPTAIAYQQIATKVLNPAPPVLASNSLRHGIVSTSSGLSHIQALFTNYPVNLANDGDYIEATVTFVSEGGILTAHSNSAVYVGLYDANQVGPMPGGIANSTAAVAGFAQNWQGYVNRYFGPGGGNGFVYRAARGATDGSNQDVVFNFLSSPPRVGSDITSTLTPFVTAAPYTIVYRITRTATGVALSTTLYASDTPTGTPLHTQTNTATGMATTKFDALAIGYRCVASVASVMNIKAVKVVTTGATTIVPEILAQPLSLTKSLGEPVEFAVQADGGAGTTLTYQWFKGAEPISGATAASYTIAAAALADAGNYTVVVTSPAGSTTSAVATLDVTTGAVAPAILLEPQGATILVGGTHTFTTAANGTSPLAYQWQRSTNGGADWTDISGATGTSYTLAGATLGDAALYRAVVTNGQGSATSAAVALVVNQAPQITVQPVGGSIALGGSLTLSVTATGTPAPTYQWRKNGTPIDGATSSTFTISGATGADTGGYTVVVSNVVSSVTSATAAVGVLSPTLAPTAFTPTAATGGRNPDTRLTITFNEPLSVGVSGVIRIHNAADQSVVDTIDLVAGTTLRDSLRAGNALSTQLLPVQKKPIGGIPNDFNYYPITVDGNTATIHPRNGVLAYGQTYYVTIEPGAFVNASGETFAGLSDPQAWRFSIKASGPAAGTTTLRVAADGSADFDTIQAALDFIPANNSTPTLIHVKSGTYFEMVGFQQKHNVTILGEHVDGTVLVYPNNNTFNSVSGVYHRATLVAQSVRDFTLANLTIINSTPQNGTQAEALVINGASATIGRNIVTNCKFYSYQDTVQFNKQTYVNDSVIHGDVDFLWGDGPTFIENCDIRFLRSAGYLTQIRNSAANHGYVFVNCRFTAPADITGVFLGRIDPNSFPASEVVILDSTFGDAAQNAFLATATGAVGSNYAAGWWRLDGTTNTNNAGNVRYWTDNLRDANGALLTNPASDAFTQMPLDPTLQANYRNATWVLNTSIAGVVNGTWTPALAPLIGSQPASRTVTLGSSTTLSVSAVGIPRVSYQWRKAGVDLPGATQPTLTLTNLSAADAANYTVVVTNSAGSLESELATVSVDGTAVPPVITTQPASQTVTEGEGFTLSVAASGTAPITYQWRKDGAVIAGATAATYTVGAATPLDAGSYTVDVTNAGGTATSDAAVITVKGIGLIRPGGYAASVTGGAAGDTVTVNTALALKTYAESATPYTIIVSGTIDLGAGVRIKPKSNKTIRGATVASTILGTIEISNANNVIISNLNISADTGAAGDNDGITITNSTNVLVTKCSIYNCTDGNLDIVAGSDLVTVSWCKFYYTRDNGHNFSNLVGSSDTDTGTGDGRTNYRVTWHHNWWTGLAKQRMLACRFGRAHMYNNLWDCTGNDYCTETRNIAAIFSERNYYQAVKNPLAKRTSLPTDVGLLMTIDNVFDACTGTQLVSADTIFTPPYSYQLSAAASVPALVRAGAGNVAVDTPAAFAAAIAGPSAAVPAGQAATLTAQPNGFTPTSYQWRFKNVALAGATSATLTLSNVQEANAGDYTVVLGLPEGAAVVSAPYTLTAGPALTTAEAWRLQYFGATAPTGDAADAADPDADGLSNLLEYALGLDPTSASAVAQPAAGVAASEWTYTYTRPADRSDLTYTVEYSTTLTGWSRTGLVHERTATGPTETWQARLPLNTGPHVFFRLEVVRP
ncbi:MAG: immunoglobulin domain-containing protein [Candidatus Didemnitutus sp.]|nr:immunoglobulin domain-containing protein [Candidatus Didemnitutus sp.]